MNDLQSNPKHTKANQPNRCWCVASPWGDFITFANTRSRAQWNVIEASDCYRNPWPTVYARRAPEHDKSIRKTDFRWTWPLAAFKKLEGL
jgi:hypothetical protein